MTEPGESVLLMRAVSEQLRKKESPTIDPFNINQNICALTWASIETISDTLLSGSLKDGSGEFADNSIPAIPTQGMSELLETNSAMFGYLYRPEKAIEDAEAEAESAAKTHFFLKQFGLPRNDPELNNAVLYYVDSLSPEIAKHNPEYTRDVFEDLERLVPNTPLKNAPLVASLARERKGFVIGIKSNFPFSVRHNEKIDGRQLIVTFEKRGLPTYDAIGMIKPNGQLERDFIARLPR